jgi:hypothetical protein
MRRYIQYLKYVLVHKWYVWQECKKQGLYLQGIIHDMSKFLPSEFIPYARFFYDENGLPKTKRDKTGYYKPTNTGNIEFDMAWARHCKRNKHHWQYWTTPQDYDGLVVFDMEEKYVEEMLYDWIAASKTQGFNGDNIKIWYKTNRNKMQISNKTARNIAKLIDERYNNK